MSAVVAARRQVAVDLAVMTHCDDENEEQIIFYRVDHAIVADLYAIEIVFSREFCRSRRIRNPSRFSDSIKNVLL